MKKQIILISIALSASLSYAGGPMPGIEKLSCSSKEASVLVNMQVSSDKYSESPLAYTVRGGALSMRKKDGSIVNMKVKGFKKVYRTGELFYDLVGQDSEKKDWIVSLLANSSQGSTLFSLEGETIKVKCGK